MSHSANSVNEGAESFQFYNVVPLDLSTRKPPSIESGARITFTAKNSLLLNPQTHKSIINTANVEQGYTKERGKEKVTNNNKTIYITKLSAPAFTQDLISVGQLAANHDFSFNKYI